MQFISDASFWTPDLLVESDWIQHSPFAFWLMHAHRPRNLVELGTARGFSYFAFNQAQQRLNSKTRCFAIDTWPTGEHDGNGVFEQVRDYNERYRDFSQLIRSTADAAAGAFADESIDLLHVDGRRSYADVKHDFETWRPKLSSRGLVLLHDTNVRAHDFGVFQLWDELSRQYPNFEFLHGRGLGLLGVGADLPPLLNHLFAASHDENLARQTREAYGYLGRSIANKVELETLSRKVGEHTSERLRLQSEVGRLEHELSCARAELQTKITEQIATIRKDELRKRELILHNLGTQTEALRTEIEETIGIELIRLRGELNKASADLAFYKEEYLKAVSSRSWKITRPLRAGADVRQKLRKFIGHGSSA
jgi:hypothetical protein